MTGPSARRPGVADREQARRAGRSFPGFTVHSLLARTGKTVLLAGSYRALPAVVKVLTSTEPAWQGRFAAEVAAYRRFAVGPPPVRVPALLAPPSADMLLLEHLPGRALATTRYPDTPLSLEDVAAVLEVADKVAAWAAPAGFPTATDYPDRIVRYGPTGYHVLDSEQVAALRTTYRSAVAGARPFSHGDLLPANVLRTDLGETAVLDWEYAGFRLAGYDHALLWVVLADDPAGQTHVLRHVEDCRTPPEAFWLNAALLLAREIRIHREAVRARPGLAARVDRLTSLARQVRARTTPAH